MPDDPISAWATIAAEARTLHGAPDQTIKPAELAVGTTGRQAIARYEHEALAEAAQRFEIGETLGEGGRGIVKLARQHALGRDVAVKALRPGRFTGPGQTGSGATLELLQEAWIAGRLEHPNIVPVYDLARGDDGSPLIVLKRVEGESWATLLGDPERARARLGVEDDDLLEAHLGVFMAVCNAVAFAHERKILHLDIKPENVMLGRHGEVYLVDWGVAAALEADPDGRLPLVAKRSGIVGTPAYMAPEMTTGEGSALSERTDIYLLGATLHELLAGAAPHTGETVLAVLYAVVHETPQLPEDAPSELAQICRRAMAREVEQRYADAIELRRAVQAFLRHRGSTRLAAQAQARFEQLELELANERDAATPDDTAQRRLQERFAEVRFGFDQALASWPQNPIARAGRLRATERFVERELERGDPQVAASLVAQVEGLPAELLARVEAAVERRRAGLVELEQLRRDQDLSIGQRTRVFVFSLIGLVSTGFPLFEQFRFHTRSNDEAYALYIGFLALTIAGFLGLRIWARDSLTRTQINRGLVGTTFVVFLSQIALMIGAWAMRLPVMQAMTMLFMLVAVAIAPPALLFDRRVLVTAVGYVVGFMLAAQFPDWLFAILAASNLLFSIVLVIAWWPERVRGQIPERDYRA